MALDISNFTGTVIAPGGANPYGDIKNNPSGTLVDHNMLHDVIIFTQRLMALNGVVPNGLPDNGTNGFQIYTALTNAIASYVDLGSWTNITLATGWTATAQTPQYRVDSSGRVYLRGAATAGGTATATFTTLPVGARPTQSMYIPCFANISGTTASFVNVLTTGVISTITIGSGNIYALDGITFLNS